MKIITGIVLSAFAVTTQAMTISGHLPADYKVAKAELLMVAELESAWCIGSLATPGFMFKIVKGNVSSSAGSYQVDFSDDKISKFENSKCRWRKAGTVVEFIDENGKKAWEHDSGGIVRYN